MGEVSLFHFLGLIISRDSFRGMWEVILPAQEGQLEVSYRWFGTCKDAEDWCMRTCQIVGIGDSVKKLYQVSFPEKGAG